MSGIFWVATIVMAVIAFGFVGLPLLKKNRRTLLLTVAIVLPVFAAGLYWKLGAPQVASSSVSTDDSMRPASGNSSSNARQQVGSVASMVDQLAARLKEAPDDGGSWLLLAKSYKHLNRIPEAIDAYKHASALGETDADLAALVNAPDSGDLSVAQIFGKLSLSDKAKEIVQPTDTVFIFARAVDGPKMPVAVLQRPASDLPLDFLLNDSQAMSADVKLSNFETVIVTARVSRSGVATDALQGLEAHTQTIRVADQQHVSLIIE